MEGFAPLACFPARFFSGASFAGDGDALAVGRVHEDEARPGARRLALERVAAAQLHGLRHAGAFGVALGEVHHAVRHVAAKDARRGGRGPGGGGGFVFHGLPFVAFEKRQALEGEAPLAAGRQAQRQLRRFDDDGAAAAAGVIQRLGGDCTPGGLPPAAGGQHGGGQGFLERGVAFVLPPAAFEKRLAAGVQQQAGVCAVQVQVNAHVGLLRLHAGARAAALAKAVGNGVFDAQGGKLQAFEGAAARGDVHAEGVARAKPVFPGHAPRQRVERVFAFARRVGQLQQHALRQAAVQVQPHHVAPAAARVNAAALDQQVLPGQAGQAVHFIGQKVLHACRAGQKEGQCFIAHARHGRPCPACRAGSRAGWIAVARFLSKTRANSGRS